MEDAFEEISFLTRSANRVAVLEALAERTHTERELVEETGITDVTAGRILEDFTDRGWVWRRDDGYATTPVGDLLAADYARIRESMGVARRLGPVLEYFPVDAFDFDVRHLTDARISDPESHDVMRAMDRVRELVRDAEHIVVVANMRSGSVAEVVREEIREGLDYRAVWGTEMVEYAREQPSFREATLAMLDAGADITWTADIERPMGVAAYDDLAALAGFDPTGALRAGIETRADPVVEWVHGTYETYRSGAARLTSDDLDG